jgi:nucleoside 2-deoxyribosyltransferase
MKKAYFGISRSNRVHFNKEIEALTECLRGFEIELFVFVDRYNFNSGQETEMMATTFKEIEQSEFLIVELSRKAIGVGIEVGYAYAKGKPVIYINQKDSNHSTTVQGCSEHIITYESARGLAYDIEGIIRTLI